jgi:hypothetical protein
VTYWADEALDVAALVLADRSSEAAVAALCASRPTGDEDGRLPAIRDRLVRCRARAEATVGHEWWGPVCGKPERWPSTR